MPSVVLALPMTTTSGGGVSSLSGLWSAAASSAAPSLSHLLPPSELGGRPVEASSSSLDDGLAPLLLQALMGAP